MRLYLFLFVTIVLLSGCAQKQPDSSSGMAPGSSPASSPGSSSARQSAPTSGAPVEFIYDGLTPEKTSVAYKIKVNTDKPIEEVHLALKETDAGGKVVQDTTLVWQNIVHSTRQPIEQGKTYADTTTLAPPAVNAQISLKEVVFKDGTRWKAS